MSYIPIASEVAAHLLTADEFQVYVFYKHSHQVANISKDFALQLVRGGREYLSNGISVLGVSKDHALGLLQRQLTCLRDALKSMSLTEAIAKCSHLAESFPWHPTIMKPVSSYHSLLMFMIMGVSALLDEGIIVNEDSNGFMIIGKTVVDGIPKFDVYRQ